MLAVIWWLLLSPVKAAAVAVLHQNIAKAAIEPVLAVVLAVVVAVVHWCWC